MWPMREAHEESGTGTMSAETAATNNHVAERSLAEQPRHGIEAQWRAAFKSNPMTYFIVVLE